MKLKSYSGKRTKDGPVFQKRGKLKKNTIFLLSSLICMIPLVFGACVTIPYQKHKISETATQFLSCSKEKVRIRRTSSTTFDTYGCGKVLELDISQCKLGKSRSKCHIKAFVPQKKGKTLSFGWTVKTKKNETINTDTQVITFRTDGNPVPTPKDPFQPLPKMDRGIPLFLKTSFSNANFIGDTGFPQGYAGKIDTLVVFDKILYIGLGFQFSSFSFTENQMNNQLDRRYESVNGTSQRVDSSAIDMKLGMIFKIGGTLVTTEMGGGYVVETIKRGLKLITKLIDFPTTTTILYFDLAYHGIFQLLLLSMFLAKQK